MALQLITLSARVTELMAQVSSLMEELREERREKAAVQQQLREAQGWRQHNPYAPGPYPPHQQQQLHHQHYLPLPPMQPPPVLPLPERPQPVGHLRLAGELTPRPAAGVPDLSDKEGADLLMEPQSPEAEEAAKKARRELDPALALAAAAVSSSASATPSGAPSPHDV